MSIKVSLGFLYPLSSLYARFLQHNTESFVDLNLTRLKTHH